MVKTIIHDFDLLYVCVCEFQLLHFFPIVEDSPRMHRLCVCINDIEAKLNVKKLLDYMHNV